MIGFGGSLSIRLLGLSLLTFRLSCFRLSLFAVSASRVFQLGNLPSCFQLRSNSTDSVMTDLSLLGNLSIALARIGLYQLCQQRSSLIETEMSSVDVSADDKGSRLLPSALEIHKLRLNPRTLASKVAIATIKYLVLIQPDRLLQAISSNVGN